VYEVGKNVIYVRNIRRSLDHNEWDKTVWSFCEKGNEISGFIKMENFFTS
jgi:hypothetical protein